FLFAIVGTPALLLASAGCGSSVQDHTTPGGAAGSSGSGGRASATGGYVGVLDGGPPSPVAFLGAACLTDADCGGSLTCLPSTSNDFLGGGPSNGLFTLGCT